MSSILKALRKLEDDKSALGEGSVDIAHDILKRRYENSATSGNLLLVGLAGLAVAAAFAVLFWVYWPMKQPQLGIVEPPPPEPVVAQRPPAKGPAADKGPVPEVNEPELSPILSQPEAKLGESQQPKLSLPLIGQPNMAGTAVAKPPPVPPVVLPDLLVSEIIDNRHPDARLAIVNDLPVMEATEIAGAQVVEILADRVRFSYKGIEFIKKVQK